MQQSASPPLRILAFGAGAIGTYFGGSLSLAGHRVVFVEQAETAARIRERGLRLDLSADRRRAESQPFVIAPSEFAIAGLLEEALNRGPFDAALFALKSFDAPAALQGMQPFAAQMPPILCLSNGVDNEPLIADVLGVDKVIYGTVTTAIGRRDAGDILLERLRGVGIASGHALSEQLAAAFDAAYLNCRLYPDAAGMKWSKMLTNLIANPTSAILDMSAAEVFADRRLYRLEIGMLRECLAVMRAQGLRVVDLPGTPVRALAFATRLPLWLSRPLVARAAGAGRGGKMPSFHIDLHAGRGQSEVGYLHGAVVRVGEQLGVSTPINRALTDTLLALTRKEIPLDEFSRRPEKLLEQAR